MSESGLLELESKSKVVHYVNDHVGKLLEEITETGLFELDGVSDLECVRIDCLSSLQRPEYLPVVNQWVIATVPMERLQYDVKLFEIITVGQFFMLDDFKRMQLTD